VPKGSPLSPLLGAIALVPLDKAMEKMKGVFYSRFMDDWVVLTRSKTALRKIVKITHQVVNALKLQLHPCKTYIGKVSHGFNFLAYYMDNQKILPSQETIRRFHERSAALLYEPSQYNQNVSRRHRKNAGRDISEYLVDEPAPTDACFKNILAHLTSLAGKSPAALAIMRRYLDQWSRWLRLGITSIQAFETSVQTLMPALFSCWGAGARSILDLASA
jgi:hypothetical protein